MLVTKVYESFVLGWLTEQDGIRENQYSGMKGAGTEHFLLELWQGVLEDFEDPRAATLLTSIDYSKAFNRLDFRNCLDSLAEKGACTNLLRIVASFLTGRKMTVKVGSFFLKERTVLGGVPQGSLLGVFLFNSSIDRFEASSGTILPNCTIGENPDAREDPGPDENELSDLDELAPRSSPRPTPTWGVGLRVYSVSKNTLMITSYLRSCSLRTS